MARYIDADKFAERIKVSPAFRNIDDGFFLQRVVIDLLNNMPTADVVPKSEVENIFAEIETCMKDFEDDDDGYLLKKCEFEFFMREIKEKYAGQKNG